MILIFGKTGQVATELQRRAAGPALGRGEVDLMDPAACAQAIRSRKPDVVINAAAYTAVDRAEDDETTATIVNSDAPTAMAQACAEIGIPYIHISTDYVFDGRGEAPASPDHPTVPLSAYGRSKLRGEEGVRASNGPHVILRTSWVFSAHGNNFLKTMLRLGRSHDKVAVVSNQFGGPTPADAIAAACLTIAEQLRMDASKSGTYHFSGAPDVSWADFAREIFDQAGLRCAVEDIPESAYPTRAKRPANSRMNCDSLTVFGLQRPNWKAAIATILDELETLT